MKKIILAVIVLIVLSAGCSSKGLLEKRELILTIGASEKLNYTLPEKAEGQKLIWTTSDPEIAVVSDDGTVTAVGFKDNGPLMYNQAFAAGTAVIKVRTENGKYKDSVKVTTTTQGQVDMMALPPLKDQFSSYFVIGNIFNPADAGSDGIVNERLVHHYNFLTAENNMKPDHLTTKRGTYNFETADRMVNAALASGLKVHGHTLLWHSQIPEWQRKMANEDKETALAAMKEFVTDVVTHFKGRVYSWDVLNEVFPDGVGQRDDWKKVMRGQKNSHAANPWFVSIGADFVYEGFLAARLADPDAILYYTDYNTDQRDKATVIRNMVQDVNDRYKREYPNANRLLIDGIGMQEHHNISVSVSGVKRAIDLFRPLGVRIAVAELDILGQSWGEYSGSNKDAPERQSTSTVSNNGLIFQAKLYGDLFKLYMENADIIERVSWWGLTDNRSWRSGGLPLIFDPEGRAKPAYYSVVGALE